MLKSTGLVNFVETPVGLREFFVTAEEPPSRLDVFLAQKLDLSRAKVQKLIAQGNVLCPARPHGVQASDTVSPGQTYHVDIPEEAPPTLEAEAVPFTVLFEDAFLMVIDKPAGLVVHPAPGNWSGTLVHGLLYHSQGKNTSLSGLATERPGIVHRLDKGTSGLMVVAKTDAAHAHLTGQFQARTLSRVYQALIWGVPTPATGTLDSALGRHPRDRKRMAPRTNGKEARTHYRVLEAFAPFASLIECRLETGRTHQIRVHMAHKGHGVLNDPLYGRAPKAVPPLLLKALQGLEPDRQLLHARALSLLHPATDKRMDFTCPLPVDFAGVLEQLRILFT